MKQKSEMSIRSVRLAIYLLCFTLCMAFCLLAVFLASNAKEKFFSGTAKAKKLSGLLLETGEKLDVFRSVATKLSVTKNLYLTHETLNAAAELNTSAFRLADASSNVPSSPLCSEVSSLALKIYTLAFASNVLASDCADPVAEKELFSSVDEMLLTASAASLAVRKIASGDGEAYARSTDAIEEFSTGTVVAAITFFVLASVLAAMGAALSGLAVRRSLKSLLEGTDALSKGNLDYRFREITPDEVGQVKYAFNGMARRIEKQSGALVHANSELKYQAEQLIEAHQHKDRFLSNMSHELRTPLNSIIGFAELMEMRAETADKEKLKGYSKRILTAAEHLLALITSLLDLAKSGAGTLKPVIAGFDMAFAVRETTEMLRPLAVKKSLEVKLDLPETLVVSADRRMIVQIFVNFFSNAVKYTEKGFVSVRLHEENGKVFLSVEDTGIGIPEKERKNLFRDFHRVNNGDPALEGAGIGLALSRRLAALHNGTITYASEEGKGSVFTFSMPREAVGNANQTET